MGFISQLIDRVKNSGWKHYYFPSNPRISGSQAAKIMTPDKVLERPVLGHPWLDPDYKPDLEQWLKTSVYEWYFYNDGAYLSVNARRNDSKDNPTKTGTYLITMEFLTERQYWVSDFDEDKDRANWKELLPARLKKYQDARRDIEDKARANGIEIDESYQDPPIKALSR
ncbi:hypothetical protein AO240_11775 [Pseudomonas sp. ICMP 460]|nr:hypothetical protein AO240_11775 [Pseudomonas sp. ICMP 460]